MLQRTVRLTLLCLALASLVLGQGINTQASADDWEEINFEFDSDVLVDGFPSLLRLAELLNQNPDYRVTLVGHTDYLGSDQYNNDLAMRRGNAVREFLEKYGARAGQITVEGRGEQDPRISAQTDEARFMNRRVQMTVADAEGRIISAGGVGDAIDALEELAQRQEECCIAILGQLEKLDQILEALEDLKNENAALRDEVAAMRKAQSDLEDQVAAVPPAPTEEQMTAVAREAAREAVGPELPVFSVLGFNLGTDEEGAITFTGRGRFFKPLNSLVALQSEAEFMSWSGRKEGQFDFGLVGRPARQLQLGGFASFRHVSFSEFQDGGTLGQASLTADYLFTRGRVGIFGAKGFMEKALLNSRSISSNIIENTYARTVDQFGLSSAIGLWGNSWAEGNIGYLRGRANPSRAGGSARLVMPFSEHWAFTAEGGVNETLLSPETYGRWAVGLQLGNFLGPRRYMEVDHPVPADIPRVRYELVTERIRTGNDAPVADAGPDLIGIPAGQVTLDGSASFDPDEDPITFRWTQVAGPAVSLSGADTATATFTAVKGASYGFHLEVADDRNGKGVDRVTVTTKDGTSEPSFLRCQVTPANVVEGETATIAWETRNADELTLSGFGDVPLSGSQMINPTSSATYTLTATNSFGTLSCPLTVQVTGGSVPRIMAFTAAPLEIVAGNPSALSWQVENADEVSISSVGQVDLIGGVEQVTPNKTTTYTLTATNQFGSATAAVTVRVLQPARIVEFVAQPNPVNPNEPFVLSWVTEGATTVSIDNNLSIRNPVGSAVLQIPQTTTYTIVASNKLSTATATVEVVVTGGVPTGTAPVADAGEDFTTQLQEITLDGSGSFNPGGGSLTYQWHSLQPLQAVVLDPGQPITRVQFPTGGVYTFQLQVTNALGKVDTDIVVVTFVGVTETP